jgi:hypothetical protein
MSATGFSRLAGFIFAIVALLQLVRAVAGWDIVIHGTSVPVMASWIAAAVAAVLSWLGFTATSS